MSRLEFECEGMNREVEIHVVQKSNNQTRFSMRVLEVDLNSTMDDLRRNNPECRVFHYG